VPRWDAAKEGIYQLPSSILNSKHRTLVLSKLYEEADKLLDVIETAEKYDQVLRDQTRGIIRK